MADIVRFLSDNSLEMLNPEPLDGALFDRHKMQVLESL